jgi:hypothetical protein
MRPLIWVSKSMEKLAAALTEMGHPIGADVGRAQVEMPHQANVVVNDIRKGTEIRAANASGRPSRWGSGAATGAWGPGATVAQDYPNNRPPTWATVISAVGQLLP